MEQRSLPYCPKCKDTGRLYKLKLHQINLFEAVYLCEKEACTYPEGYKIEIVQRNLKELSKNNKLKKQSSQADVELDLDRWLLDVCNTLPETSSANNDLTSNDLDLDSFLEQLTGVSIENQENSQRENDSLTKNSCKANVPDVANFINELSVEFDKLQSKSSEFDKLQNNSSECNTLQNNLSELVVDSGTTYNSDPESFSLFNTNLKTYRNKSKTYKLNDKSKDLTNQFSHISTKDLFKEILQSTEQPSNGLNIDYITPEVDNTQLTDNESEVARISMAGMFNFVTKRLLPDTKKTDAINNIKDEDLNEYKTKIVYQNENIKMRVYNSLYDLPVEYQEKILNQLRNSDERFRFNVVAPEKLEKSLQDSVAENYSPQVKPVVERRKSLRSRKNSL